MENLKIDPAALKTESNNSINDKLESVDLIQQNKDLTSCLESSFKSSKLDKLIKIVMETLEKYPEDKLIVVSQWTGVLRIVGKDKKPLFNLFLTRLGQFMKIMIVKAYFIDKLIEPT